jgi:hypothetical protein
MLSYLIYSNYFGRPVSRRQGKLIVGEPKSLRLLEAKAPTLEAARAAADRFPVQARVYDPRSGRLVYDNGKVPGLPQNWRPA